MLALACGIGAAAATWSLLSSVLIEPLPVSHPKRLFVVEAQWPALPGGLRYSPSLPYQDFEAIAASGAFESLAAGGYMEAVLVTEQGDSPRQRGLYFANHEFFSTLGVDMAFGRAFAADEDVRGAAPVAVLSYAYWRNAFDADANVLGRTVRVAESTVTIVGVLPRGFRGLDLAETPDLYLPLHTIDDIGISLFSSTYLGPGVAWMRVVGRLRDGETPAVAATRIDASLAEDREYALRGVNIAAVPEAARAGMAQLTTLLSTTVGLLALIGCLTVGMLLLVRTEDRRDDFGICLALGATRMRLASGIAAEAAILSVLGALLAIPVAWVLYSGVRAFRLPGGIDIRLLELSFDVGAWLAIAAATLLATCVIALLASLVGLAGHKSAPLQPRTITGPRKTRRAIRTALVAGQVAIALVLVAGAGLFTRSLMAALSLNTHLDSAGIVMADVWLQPYGYTPERAVLFFDELRDRLRANGAIESVSIARSTGGMAPGFLPVTIDGVPREIPSLLTYTEVDDAYFSALRLPILRGRSFTREDFAGAPVVAVVSESFGRLIAEGGNPIGRRITFRPSGEEPAVAEVIGVVPDVITNVNMTEPLAMYHVPGQRSGAANATLVVVRAAEDPRAAMREVMAAIEAMDRSVAPTQMSTLDEQIGRQMNAQRFGMYVLGTLGGIALLLTILGTYVLAEAMVVGRRREMSIRAALGARASQLGGIVLRDTACLVGIGLMVGIVLAVLGARSIRALLYQIEPLDPIVLASVSAVILGLALLVSLRPALEATRLDLTRSLREE